MYVYKIWERFNIRERGLINNLRGWLVMRALYSQCNHYFLKNEVIMSLNESDANEFAIIVLVCYSVNKCLVSS